jgi:hypothetical protein
MTGQPVAQEPVVIRFLYQSRQVEYDYPVFGIYYHKQDRARERVIMSYLFS